VAEDLQAQVGQGALADPPDEVGLGEGGGPHDERAEHEGDHHEVQRALVALQDPRVDRRLGQRCRRQRRRRPGHERDEHGGDARAVGREQDDQPA
jgi:hypothetical protein